MPHIQPVDAVVSWPANEGVIGVVGVAPWATVDFLKALYAQVDAEKDWHFPRVLCDINTKLPSRGRHLELGERDPSPFIAETIAELAHQGATVVVVPCNTAHILYSSWGANAPVDVPSIITAAVSAVEKAQGQVAVFASKSIYQYGLYEKALAEANKGFASLSSDQILLIGAVIGAVKRMGRIPTDLLRQVDGLLRELSQRNVDALILGCTELTVLRDLARSHLPCVVDSNAALAREALLRVGISPAERK